MSVTELKELKAQYERELVFAEAKVSVINEIIAKAEAEEQMTAVEVNDTAENADYTQSSY